MCGLFGFLIYGDDKNNNRDNKININELTDSLAVEAAVRGTDATGVAYNDGELKVYKRPVSAYKLTFKLPNIRAVVGHTRHATQGAIKKNYNNHPFTGRAGKTEFALAHNGVLMNDIVLRESLNLPPTKIETDSYIAVQLIESQRKLDMESLAYMAEQVQGSYSFSVLDEHDNIYLVKGDSPIYILHFPQRKLYIYASTAEILWKAIVDTELFGDLRVGKYEEVKLTCGDILKICRNGKLEYGKFNYSDYTNLGCDWRNYDINESYYDTAYYADLVSAASGMGITAEDIDELLSYGLTYDEIEEYIYCGEEV